MTYNHHTTLRRIRNGSPASGRACAGGYVKLLRYVGKIDADDEPISLLTVLNSNGLDDALWVLSYAMPDDRLARHFQAWCAEQVLHLFEAARPNDNRVREQIAMLRNDSATASERAAARAAAWDAARDVVCAASWAVVWDAALAAAWAAARDATRDAAWAATWAAAWVVARASARHATRDAARSAQEIQLRQMIEDSK